MHGATYPCGIRNQRKARKLLHYEVLGNDLDIEWTTLIRIPKQVSNNCCCSETDFSPLVWTIYYVKGLRKIAETNATDRDTHQSPTETIKSYLYAIYYYYGETVCFIYFSPSSISISLFFFQHLWEVFNWRNWTSIS